MSEQNAEEAHMEMCGSVTLADGRVAPGCHVDTTPDVAEIPHCPHCGRAGVSVGLNSVLIEARPTVRFHACGVGGPGSSCYHEWLDRPESDTRECLICGTEVAG